MVKSTVLLRTRGTLHLASVEVSTLFIILSISPCLIIIILVEFSTENILLVQLLHSPLCPFYQLFDLARKWMRMIGKLSPRWNIPDLQYGKFLVSVLAFFTLIANYSQPLSFPFVIKPRSLYTTELIRSGLEISSSSVQSYLSLFPIACIVFQFTLYALLCFSSRTYPRHWCKSRVGLSSFGDLILRNR
jgi:hypothetical protein